MNDNEEHGLLKNVGFFLNILAVIGMFFIFVFMVWMLPKIIVKRRESLAHNDPIETTHWNLTILYYWCGIYFTFVTVVLGWINMTTELNWIQYWPSLSGLIGLGSSHGFSIGWDLFITVIVACIAIPVSSCYGYHDEELNYRSPDWVCRDRHLAEIDDRIKKIIASDPALNPTFITMSGKERQRVSKEWRDALLEEQRRREQVVRLY